MGRCPESPSTRRGRGSCVHVGSLWLHGPDGHDTLVYPESDHIPAGFTVLNLAVESIEDAVDEVTARGVRFERYEGLETDDRGIFHGESHSVA